MRRKDQPRFSGVALALSKKMAGNWDRSSASFRDQIFREQPSRFDERSESLTGLRKPALQRRDANLVILDAQIYLLADLEA
jgi:hypothetical protein